MTTRVPSRESWTARGSLGAAGEGTAGVLPPAGAPVEGSGSGADSFESNSDSVSVTPAILPGSGYLRIVSNVNNTRVIVINPFDAAQEAAQTILGSAGLESIDIALVLGSGWGGAADALGETVCELDAEAVPGFAASGVAGHSGTLRIIRFNVFDRPR